MRALLSFLGLNAHWLAAGFLLTFASSFGQTFFISIFAGEIRGVFGLSNGQWGGIYTLATTASAATMVWMGGLADRFRARALGVAVLFGLAAATLAMAAVPNVWALVVVIFLLRLTGQGMTTQVAMVAIARWFAASRGRALSVATLGVATGEAFLPLSFVALMGVFDWRWLWGIATVIVLALVPVLMGLLRTERTPQSLASGARRSPGLFGRDWTRGEVLRHWLFWLMVPTLLGPAMFNTAFFFHQVHFAATKGWDHVALVALFPFYSMFNVGAMIASGWAVDRFGSGRITSVFLLPMAAGYLLLAQAPSPATAWPGLVLMGVTTGTAATISAAFWAEFYGTRHLGAIRATTTAVMVFGTALGPGITGALIDFGIEFRDQLPAIAGYLAAASALAWIGVARARRFLPRPA
ncbi:MFS transporter [Rhodobacteraceae bacterium WD3A24]|nr:MFS transporter [Rhodobacteraceae bacterium WD3A24]